MAENAEDIPKKFSSYEMLNRWLLNYQETTQNKFNVHTSDSLIKIYKKRSYVDFNPYLIYDRIKYKCSTREKNELDSADTCPARLSVSTSPHKKTLQVNECHLNHNHAPMIIGRDGPFKQRQLLLENAIKLHQEMEKKKPRGDKIIVAQKSRPSSLKTIDKLTMKKPVVIISRIIDHTDKDLVKFYVFLDRLHPKVSIHKITNRKELVQLHQLTKIDKDNVVEFVNFNLTERKHYFSESAFMHLKLLLGAKKKI